MDNLDDSENNAKISDSAYSNSCSNSQSRRSHSSKSTHSGSHSSGSSGYGGKPSTSGSSNNLSQPPKKDKESKKKKQQTEALLPAETKAELVCRPPEPVPAFEAPKEEPKDVVEILSPARAQSEKGAENMEISTPEHGSLKDEDASVIVPVSASVNFVTSRPNASNISEGFSCVISMHDGVVMYTTSSLTSTLGYPKDMWIGRSFIDFVHPRDRNTFASQITSGLAVPKIVNGTQEKAQSPGTSGSTMVCRIRRYRGLTAGFGVKDRVVTFMPFLLKFTFKNICDEEGKVIYLVIQATPFYSAFKVPNEIPTKAVPFVMRHAANGNLEYIDPESVPYLGYLPQDVTDKDALQLYHPEDLPYLRQVYEAIVKEGGLSRSKTYRIMTQNGDFIKLESEWSSFINPWSKKLEFVIGKHHIIEGPSNPDVFQSPDPENGLKMSDEEKNKALGLRESIVRIMNEVLTKPAEVAKQQMSKRCQDLALFMETLMEEQPKTDEELRLEIQDADHSYYERDSVMLGGISPHHDYNDSKSSTETPLSYNQLNYNETLQRYFESHQPYSFDDYNAPGENTAAIKEPKPATSNCLSPVAQNSRDSAEMDSSCESAGVLLDRNSPVVLLGDYQPVRLTESLLNKHNAEMEKELVKMHRETRSSSKSEREKVSNETRQKKKEHLARCNATFQPTQVSVSVPESVSVPQPHGVKRASKQQDTDPAAHKHHCTSQRQTRRRHVTNAPNVQPTSTSTTTAVGQSATHWSANTVSNMNTFILGVGIPQQMSLMSPVPAMPGMFPMYYAPAQAAAPCTSTTVNTNTPSQIQSTAAQFPAMMMYGQPVYGSPFMYSPLNPQVSYPIQQTLMAQSMQYTNALHPLGLTSSNYEEACKTSLPLRPGKSGGWRDKKRSESQGTSSKTDQESAEPSTIALNRSTEAVPDTSVSRDDKSKTTGNSEETVDRTDGESSYSSFYSSFFKTESGSAEESDAKKQTVKESNNKGRFWDKAQHGDDGMSNSMDVTPSYYKTQHTKKVARRKMEPPWMEQVCVTSELIYKYQILTKTMDEVLSSDKKKINELEQPSLVNEQLGQLYLDLQLEGVAARLTLEEGITSSSSSGEETPSNTPKGPRRKREYSKLVMIYEEDAPLPPPVEEDGLLDSPMADRDS